MGEVEIRPPGYSGVGKNRKLVKLAVMAAVCEDHVTILEKQPKFYTCGCSYAGVPKCPIHDNNLTRFSRDKNND